MLGDLEQLVWQRFRIHRARASWSFFGRFRNAGVIEEPLHLLFGMGEENHSSVRGARPRSRFRSKASGCPHSGIIRKWNAGQTSRRRPYMVRNNWRHSSTAASVATNATFGPSFKHFALGNRLRVPRRCNVGFRTTIFVRWNQQVAIRPGGHRTEKCPPPLVNNFPS